MIKQVPTIEVLRAARTIVRLRWGRGGDYENARNIHGTPVLAESDGASTFCILGGIDRVLFDRLGDVPASFAEPLLRALDIIACRLYSVPSDSYLRPCAYASDRYGRNAAIAILDAAIDELSCHSS